MIFAFVSFSSSAHIARAEPTLEVRSATRLRLEIVDERERRAIQIDLHDDLGAPIPGRMVRLSVEGEAEMAIETDARGSARLALDERWEGRRLRAEVEPSPHLDGAAREITFGDSLARVDLVPTLASPGTLPVDEGLQTIRVHARSSAGAAGLHVRVTDERGRLLAEAETDALGRAHLGIDPRDLGDPGPGRLVFESDADEARREGEAVLPVVRTLRSTVELDSPPSKIRPGQPLVIRGALTTARGPLASRAVSLSIDGERVSRSVTDSEGRFRLEYLLDESTKPVLEAIARFDGGADGAEPSESPALRIAVRAPLAKWPFVLLPLAFALVVALARRSRLEAPSERAARRSPFRSLFERPTRRLRLRLHTLGGAPVSGARVSLGGDLLATSDAAGEASVETLPLGRHVLRIEAEGFVSEAFEIEIPIRGTEPRLVSLVEAREAATLALCEMAASRGAPGHRIVASTHREIGRDVERARGELDDLVDDVDRAYYGPETPDEESIRALRERFRHLQG